MIRITDKKIQPFEIKHLEKIRKIGSECTLLLKSNGLLPIIGLKNVALFGSGARRTIKGGKGSGDVNVRHFVTIEEGLENVGIHIVSKKWLDDYDAIMSKSRVEYVEKIKLEAAAAGVYPVLYAMGKTMAEPEYELSLDYDADLAIYVLSRDSGEGSDRKIVPGDIYLSKTEIRDINTLESKYKNFLLVLNVGGLVDLEPVSSVKNILLLGQLGQETGNIFADLLSGKTYPSGKLAMSWAQIDEYPSTDGYAGFDDTVYSEGIYVGYRYFDTINKAPDFAFGYGLSYTTFDIETKSVKADENNVNITVKVKNTGRFKGKEVVQVYYSAPSGKLEKPYQELAAFAKTKELCPGESQEITIVYSTADMSSYDESQAAYIMEEGRYIIRVGNSSRNTKAVAAIELDHTAVISKLRNICSGWNYEPLFIEIRRDEELDGIFKISLDASKLHKEEVYYEEEPSEIHSDEIAKDWSEVISGKKSVDNFVEGLTNEQLTYLSLGLFDENGSFGSIIGAAAETIAGGAGETTQKLKPLGVPTITMADGPAGIRVCTEYKIVNGKVKGIVDPMADLSEFADGEFLKEMKSVMVLPSKEEIDAPINYCYCTAIPIGTSLAQSWNEETCEICGDIVGEEMEMFGVNLWLAPAMNIQRSPLCGRDFEYYSEDPLISGRLAAAITRGIQQHKGCGTTIKHFACNNQETNRIRSNSVVNERALREIYLKGFEIAIRESQPKAVMTSYNLINGEHTCNSKELITYVLRNEWGYKGIVMTDWYVTTNMMSSEEVEYKHPIANAAGCVLAGNDITMPGAITDKSSIVESIDNPEAKYPINRAHLQASAKRILNMILELV